MTVHFIGAGPGATDLITLRGQRLLQTCQTCLYAGSLVQDVMCHSIAKPSDRIDTASMTLDAIIHAIETAHHKGHDVARLHSGDPSFYGTLEEQMRLLALRHIPYTVTPGVPSFAAAAAALQTSLTTPNQTQTIVLTRYQGQATPMPEKENLTRFAQTQATLVIHLSIRAIRQICQCLIPYYGEDCPTAVIYKASWQEQKIILTNLKNIAEQVKNAKITRHALIIVKHHLATPTQHQSALYSCDHQHIMRPAKTPRA